MLSSKLDKALVLKAIYVGFQETMKPAICSREGLQLALLCFLCVCYPITKEQFVLASLYHKQDMWIVNGLLSIWSLFYDLNNTCLFDLYIILLWIVPCRYKTNKCLHNNGSCWQVKTANVTACKVCSLS